jgi:hypothetical protein
MSAIVKFILTAIVVIGLSIGAYYAVEKKFTYKKFNDNIDDLEAVLRVEKRIAKKRNANREDVKEHDDRMKNILAHDEEAKEKGLEITELYTKLNMAKKESLSKSMKMMKPE